MRDLDFGFENLAAPLAALPQPVVNNGKQSSVDLVAGKAVTVDISRDAPLTAIKLLLTAIVTTAAGSSSGTARAHNPVECLERIEVWVEGKDNPIVLTGVDAYILTVLSRLGQQPHIVSGTTTQFGVAATKYTLSAEIWLDLVELGVEPEHLGLLDPRRMNSVQLKLYGASSFDAALADSLTTPSVACTANVQVELATLGREADGPIGLAPQGYGSILRSYTTTVVTATESKKRFDLDRGFLYNRIVVVATTAATNNLSDAVFTGDWQVNVDRSEQGSGTAASLIARQKALFPAGFSRTGIYVIDFIKPDLAVGRLKTHLKGMNALSAGEAQLYLGVTTGTNTQIRVVSVVQRDPQSTARAWKLRGRPVERDANGMIVERFPAL